MSKKEQNQPVVRDTTVNIGGYYHGDRFVICPECKCEVSLRVSYYDSYAKKGPAQVHYDCLSQQRKDEIQAMIERGE